MQIASSKHRSHRQVARRRAFTVLELTVAAAVLAILFATSMRMIRVVSDEQRASERRNVALQAVQAISEQVGNVPWEQLTAESVEHITIPDQAVPHLPGAKVAIAVNEELEPAAKRVLVEITWGSGGGKRTAPVRLTSWVFPEEAQLLQ
jgi:type II secretory pathway pseudopilin PulG